MPQLSAAGQLGKRQPQKNMAQDALIQHEEFCGSPLSGTDFFTVTTKQTENRCLIYSKDQGESLIFDYSKQKH